MKLRHLDLFSGIGGFSLGLEATGAFETVAFCDIEKYCLEVLEKRFPHVPRYTDLRELNYEKLKADGIISDGKKIDIITVGYPCQPFSVAGRKKGEEDPRHLWPEYFRLVQELQPTWVIGENVSGHIKLGLDTVIENLEAEGYAVRTFSISASSVGANHQRERVWIVAHLEDTRQHGGGIKPSGNTESIGRGSLEKTEWTTNADQTSGSGEGEEITTSEVAHTNSERGRSGETRREDAENVGQSSRRAWDGWWDIEPNVGRVAHGVSKRVDRLKSLGNSLVPSIPYYIGLSIIQSYMANTDGAKSFDTQTSQDNG